MTTVDALLLIVASLLIGGGALWLYLDTPPARPTARDTRADGSRSRHPSTQQRR